jgi:hypothetical protein
MVVFPGHARVFDLVVDATGGTSTRGFRSGGDIDGEQLMINLAILYVGGRKSFIHWAPLMSGKDLSQDMLDFLKAEVRCFAVSHRFASGILTCLFLILGAKSQCSFFSRLVNAINQNTGTCFKSVCSQARQRQEILISRRGVGSITISTERVTLFSSRRKNSSQAWAWMAQIRTCGTRYVLHLQRRTPHQLRCSRSRESGLYYLLTVWLMRAAGSSGFRGFLHTLQPTDNSI